jgi:glycerophosphoryl diester phosphodiesterase
MPARGICAHRGDVEQAPENTIPAFLLAVEKGAHMLEFDVWMTCDGELVIMHDPTVDRTTDGTGTIVNMTLEQIKSLDAGVKFGAEFAGTRVPTLGETLAAPIPPNVWLNIHTRDHGQRDEEYMDKLLGAIEKANRTQQICLACFAPQAEIARRRLPEIQICNMTGQSHAGSDYPRITIELGARFIQFFGAHGAMPEAVKLLHSHGVKVNYFKADDPQEIRWALEIGVDFVLTDRLDAALAVWNAGQWGAPA